MGFYDEVMADSPAFYWRFDGRIGRAHELIAGRHGVYQGGPLIAQRGVLGPESAMTLNGSSQSVSLASGTLAALNGAAGVTIEAVLRLESLSATSQVILSTLINSASNIAGGNMVVSSTGLVGAFRSRNADSAQIVSAGTAPPVGAFVHLVARANFAAKTASLFQAGALIGNATGLGFGVSALSVSAATLSDGIGGQFTSPPNNAHATIDEIVIYGSALSDARIAAHAAALVGHAASGHVLVGTPPAPQERRIILVSRDGRQVSPLVISDPGDGSYSTEVSTDAAIYGLAYIDYGDAWSPGIAYALADRSWPRATPNGHWYEVEVAGSTDAAEPIWPTDGSTVVDGTVTWRDKGVMERPWAEGPYLPQVA